VRYKKQIKTAKMKRHPSIPHLRFIKDPILISKHNKKIKSKNTSENSAMFLEQADELIIYIFSFVSYKDLMSLSRVSSDGNGSGANFILGL
jgi:hypothetical protein